MTTMHLYAHYNYKLFNHFVSRKEKNYENNNKIVNDSFRFRHDDSRQSLSVGKSKPYDVYQINNPALEHCVWVCDIHFKSKSIRVTSTLCSYSSYMYYDSVKAIL